jgi:hypothetical protein
MRQEKKLNSSSSKENYNKRSKRNQMPNELIIIIIFKETTCIYQESKLSLSQNITKPKKESIIALIYNIIISLLMEK